MASSSVMSVLALCAVLLATPALAARSLQDVRANQAARTLLADNSTAGIEDIEALFDDWNAALKTGNPDAVLSLYAPDAVLLATLANPPLNTADEIRDYFVSFLKKKPSGVINEQNVRMLNPTTAINSGVYTFSFAADNSTAYARFTYLYKVVNGKWLISFHHSSLLPESGVGIKTQLQGQIEAAFRSWNAALQTKDPLEVAALYLDDAVLLPTVSNWVRVGRDAIIDYFKDFLAKEPYGRINIGQVTPLGDNVASYTGVYTFTFKDRSAVMARFSYTYVNVGGKWLIENHHSSALPQPVVT